MVPPDVKLSVEMEARAWDTVLMIMSKAPVPYEITAPLLSEIQRQCVSQQKPLALVPSADDAPAAE